MKVYSHSLQGKREANEDQHVHILNLNGENGDYNSINLFGVFDGHGGAEVALFVKKHFVNELKNNSNFLQKNYE
jgi:serine/threonine protein phosphatase PrpC